MKRFIYISILIVFTFILTACGKSLTGMYKLISLKEDGQSVSLTSLDNLDLAITLEINGSNAILTSAGMEDKMTIKDDYFIRTDEDGNKSTIPFSTVDDKIIIGSGDNEMIFQKQK